MKRKLIIAIMLLLITVAFVSCEKGTVTIKNEETMKEETEQAPEGAGTEDTAVIPQEAAKITPNTVTTGDIPGDDVAAADVTDEPILMSAPPFSYYISGNITDKKGQAIKLNLISSEPNKITDENEWFINHNLSLSTYPVPGSFQDNAANIQDEIDQEVNGLTITSVIHDDSYSYYIYGANYSEGYILNIYDVKTHRKAYSLDFSNYRYSPEYIEEDYDYIQQKINWAEIKDNILYVNNSHNTYAKSSDNMNAYITAIDLADMSILWRTEALVCNLHDFQIIGDVIIGGYGFTDEEDYLYQVDKNNGEVLEKIPLKSAPSYIIEKDNVLYVRTYNTDYEFDIVR